MITLSVCMIVKNEEKVLSRCLDSLKGIWDELIIVDTGSNDNTKKIAALYTEKIYNFVWTDDFSAARNFAFSKCSQDYIYTVDADEVVDEENKQKLLLLKQKLLSEIEIVQMYYVNANKENSVYNFQKELRPKWFKRLRQFQWIDPIHERMRLQPIVYDSDIEILHLPEGQHSNRDLQLLGKLVTQGKKLSDMLYKMYARELYKAGEKADFNTAKNYFLNQLEQCDSVEKRQMAQCILIKTARIENDMHCFLKHCFNQLAEGATSELCCEIGSYFLNCNEPQEAVSWFENACHILPCMDIHCCGDKPMKGMADCYEKMGDTEKSQYWTMQSKNWTPPEEA